MAPSTQLNATEQDTVVKQIGLSLLRAAPRDWRRITAQYRAVGRYHELTGEIVLADGETQEWIATHDIATLFGRLRTGMYREGRGTWFNARYQLDHPSSYNLEYDREEPEWELPPPPQAYADELRMFPRSEENVPDWLMRRMAGLTPEQQGPRFRIARIFDGTDSEGYPIIDRPEISTEDQERLLDFLNGAPVVIPGRGYDVDHLASTPENRVPIAFHSDGTWIWPAAVNYYLREYGMAPEPDLMQHIHARGFSVPDVSHSMREAAAAHISRGGPPSQPPAPPVETAPPPQASPGEEPETAEQPPDEWSPHPAEQTQIAQQPPPEGLDVQQPDRYDEELVAEEPFNGGHDRTNVSPAGDQEHPTTFRSPLPTEAGAPTTTTTPVTPPYTDQDPPGAGPAAQAAPDQAARQTVGEHPSTSMIDEPVVHDLDAILMDLGVPESTYRIGEPIEEGWALEEIPEGWRVGWYNNQALTGPAVFGDVQDAAAFMLGKLLLTPVVSDQERQAPAQSPPQQSPEWEDRDVSAPSATADTRLSLDPVSSTPQTEHAPASTAHEAPEDDPNDRRKQENGATEQGGKQQWPIQPLPGEPPLTLFRGKELQELPAGSELDRFGDPDGNLLYAAGTPFEERSLVPEWVNRPYHVYRLQRPLETLTGVAIPWFNQPGGGAAYVLPMSIAELIATGDLIELDAEEPPID